MAASQVAEGSRTLLVQEIVAQFTVSVGDENENAKLEAIGYHVGLRVVERLAKDKPRFGEDLEVVKFICKDFWTAVFKKQIDNLKTNHKVRNYPHTGCRRACHLASRSDKVRCNFPLPRVFSC
eukprot:SAG25_NODE_5076_length_706_cov_0.996705_2_plen_123_part_00